MKILCFDWISLVNDLPKLYCLNLLLEEFVGTSSLQVAPHMIEHACNLAGEELRFLAGFPLFVSDGFAFFGCGTSTMLHTPLSIRILLLVAGGSV